MYSDLRPADVRSAATRIAAHVKLTRLTQSSQLSTAVGGSLYLKCENEQTTGSFKLRGALNAIAALPMAVASRGVVASSAGNHGLGVAYAAQAFGVKAKIFIPRHAPKVKKEGILQLGAEVIDSEPDYDAAMVAAKELASASGSIFINPCLGDSLIAGQGTVGLEILQQLPEVKTVIVPVGGAGLLGGIAAMIRFEAPHVKIIGAQSVNTAAMSRSLNAGQLTEIPSVRTLADGLAGQIDDEAYGIGQFALDRIVEVTEDEIGRAIAWLWVREKQKVEGAGAVGIAAVLARKLGDLDYPAVAILSGRNIDEDVHRDLVARFGDQV